MDIKFYHAFCILRIENDTFVHVIPKETVAKKVAYLCPSSRQRFPATCHTCFQKTYRCHIHMDFASSGNVWSILYGGDDVASLYGDIPPPSNILRSLQVLLVLFHRAHFLVR